MSSFSTGSSGSSAASGSGKPSPSPSKSTCTEPTGKVNSRANIHLSASFGPAPSTFNREVTGKVGVDCPRHVDKKLKFRLFAVSAGKSPNSKVAKHACHC